MSILKTAMISCVVIFLLPVLSYGSTLKDTDLYGSGSYQTSQEMTHWPADQVPPYPEVVLGTVQPEVPRVAPVPEAGHQAKPCHGINEELSKFLLQLLQLLQWLEQL